MTKEMMSTNQQRRNEVLKYFNGDELATDVWLSKYAQEEENTPDDMHWRMAKEFARIEENYAKSEFIIHMDKDFNPYQLSDYGRRRVDTLSENAIHSFLENYKYIVMQGSVAATLGTDKIASLSNCWVAHSPTDSYGGIHRTDGELIYFFKRRGGVGTNIDTLRYESALTNNSAKTSTGAVSFAPRFSNTTREVASEGRRGALMLMMFINHPDILKFINIKRDLTQITGANISVKIFDGFMQALIAGEDYQLQFPCESDKPIYIKNVEAKKIWDELIDAAWTMAEPGVVYWDNVMNYDPASVYAEFKAIAANPCGEQFLNALDSCRLLFLNLFSFVNKVFTTEAEFDDELFYKMAYEQLRLGDDLVDLEIEYIDRIIAKIESDPEEDTVKRAELELWTEARKIILKGRRAGAGISGLGDMLAGLGLKYDSKEALDIVDKIMHTKLKAELACTIDLAILRGPFKGWDKDLEFNFDKDGNITSGKNKFYQFLFETFPEECARMCIHGRRSVNWSTLAPCGSKSTQTQTTSSGEPLFAPWFTRRKKINPGEGGRVDFVDQNGDSWQEYPVLHPKFKDWINTKYENPENSEDPSNWNKEDLQIAFELSPWYGSTANEIDWIKRVEMQAVLQKYTTNAISSTINLPNDVSKEKVSEIYLESWKVGLKGQTVYRDGCRTGVLITDDIIESTPESFKHIDAPKRPKVLACEVHQTRNRGNDWLVVVGLMDGKPYEVFCVPNGYSLPKSTLQGDIVKMTKGKYMLDIKDVIQIENICTSFENDAEEVMTRLISSNLRHGANIKFIVEQLNKSEGDITSFSKAVARVLKKYIPNGEKSTISCFDCDSDAVVFEEGCQTCKACGSSKCG